MPHRLRRPLPLVVLLLAAAIVVSACKPIPANYPVPVRRYFGNTFDTCNAPTTFQMAKWRTTFGGVGIYIGGANRGCPNQTNLDAGWVASARRMKYHLLPLYVGLQAPCGPAGTAKFNPFAAGQEGAAAATDAVRKARALGIGQRSPIFFDMEAYGRDPGCIRAVRVFISAWVARLHQHGYYAGLYSSSGSGIADQDAIYSFRGYRKPDTIWFANWDGRRSVYSDPYISNSHWTNHRRHHQYQGGHTETHNGVTLNIDRSISDGWVA